MTISKPALPMLLHPAGDRTAALQIADAFYAQKLFTSMLRIQPPVNTRSNPNNFCRRNFTILYSRLSTLDGT
jgi:hypothetical protein